MKSIGGMESMKMSVKGKDYERNKKILIEQSELQNEPIGIYFELDNQIDGSELGFQIVIDKDDLINPSEITMDCFGGGRGLNILRDFTMGLDRVKQVYKKVVGSRTFKNKSKDDMSLDEFWSMSVRDSLVVTLNQLRGQSKFIDSVFKSMEEYEGNDVEGGFIIKMKMFNNNSQNFKVQFSDMKFKSDHMDWIDEVLLTMFPNQPMEVN